MRIVNRRAFLRQVLGSTALVGLVSQLSLSQEDELNSELGLALTVWKKNETSSPYIYIDKIIKDGVELKKVIQEEFLKSNVLEVDGLILSKLEVAFLASLALEKVNTKI
jgi:hypothetical protein